MPFVAPLEMVAPTELPLLQSVLSISGAVFYGMVPQKSLRSAGFSFLKRSWVDAFECNMSFGPSSVNIRGPRNAVRKVKHTAKEIVAETAPV